MSEQPQPAEGQCAFFLPKKRRFCRFRPNQGHKYCAEHACVLGVELDRKRIVCPLNPKHTCYEDNLEKHLKKCNSRKRRTEDYYEEGINAGSDDEDSKPKTQTAVKATDTERLKQLIDRVNQLYEEHIGKVEEDVRSHECLQQEMENPYFGLSALRHRRQQASLIGQLEGQGLLTPGHCYVEMGAGKGQLSHWVRQAVSSHDDASFLLVDRSSIRYKVDGYHKEETVKFERIKMDIEHLYLGKVPMVAGSERPLVAMGKHLCGAATDLTLRCLMGTVNATSSKSTISEPCTKRPRTEDSNSTNTENKHSVMTSLQALSKDAKLATPENKLTAQIGDADSSGDYKELDLTKSQTFSDDTNSVATDNQISAQCAQTEDADSSREDRELDLTKSRTSSEGMVKSNSEDHDNAGKDVGNCGVISEDKGRNVQCGRCNTSGQHRDTSECRYEHADGNTSSASSGNNQVAGVLIALCCHHQCAWRAYVGKKFMRQCGLTAADFNLLTRLTSWAVCGWRDRDGSFGKTKEAPPTTATPEEKADVLPPSQSGAETGPESMKTEDTSVEEEMEHDTADLVTDAGKKDGLQLTEKQKETVGWRCKRLIDYGRVCFLRERGLNSDLKIYIDARQTPENVVLIASPRTV